MKTASQIIRAFLYSPDQHPLHGTPEFEALCQDARDFLAAEQEVQEARTLVKFSKFDEARAKLDKIIAQHGLSEPVLQTEQYMGRVRDTFRTLKLQALLKEALELASQDDADFGKDGRGQLRVIEIAKEAAAL